MKIAQPASSFLSPLDPLPLPRILVVSYYGHAASTRPEAEIYLSLKKLGYDITVITHGESEYVTRFRESGIKVLFGHPVKRRDEEGTAIIRNELLAHDYDVLMLYNSRSIANGVRAAKGLPVKVAVYRGCAADVNWYDPFNYLKILNPRVDAILCNNVGVQRHIQANKFGQDITTVVNKGHDLAWYEGIEPIDKTTIGVPADAPMLICVANASKFKGVPYLLAAMGQIDPTLNVHLVLCGRRMDTEEHRTLAKASGYPERIIYPGFRDDVYRLVAAADVKVLPSVRGESLTKAAVEAMSLGTTLLLTDLPGNEELVTHGESGWKVPPRDSKALAVAIEKLVQDSSLRQNLAAAALQRLAGPLSHKTTVENMDAFFSGMTT
ncbi:MAG: glycosyltransferase family 4 protein [Saprospiraceae bacterium]